MANVIRLTVPWECAPALARSEQPREGFTGPSHTVTPGRPSRPPGLAAGRSGTASSPALFAPFRETARRQRAKGAHHGAKVKAGPVRDAGGPHPATPRQRVQNRGRIQIELVTVEHRRCLPPVG